MFYVYACILAIVLNVKFAMSQGRPFEEDEIEGDEESVAHLEEEGITVIHHAEPGKGLNHPGWVAVFHFTYKRSFHHLDLKKYFPLAWQSTRLVEGFENSRARSSSVFGRR